MLDLFSVWADQPIGFGIVMRGQHPGVVRLNIFQRRIEIDFGAAEKALLDDIVSDEKHAPPPCLRRAIARDGRRCNACIKSSAR